MKVSENQVFNLMDTNGRRNDVIQALQGYLEILDEILNVKRMTWKSVPDSLAQFEFYKQAIAQSPDVFKKHDKFDKIMEKLDSVPPLKIAVEENDIEWIQDNQEQYRDVLADFDLGAEDRARHYTSNLVKLGFTDEGRTISEVGMLLLGKKSLRKDKLESLLPINDMNIIYLRQLLKLRVYSADEERFYAPFCMAIYSLLKRGRISYNEFCELVQGLSPYRDIPDLNGFVEQYKEGDVAKFSDVEIPEEIAVGRMLEKEIFNKHFKNRKSASAVDVYYEFYVSLYKFCTTKSKADLEQLLTIYEKEKPKLNKAFGYGRNLFENKRGARPGVESFLEQSDMAFETENLNVEMYMRFASSKTLDVIREYSDTTVRIFKATGLISFENGYVELANRDLCEEIFEEEQLRELVFGSRDGAETAFCKVHSVAEILKYSDEKLAQRIGKIQTVFGGVPTEDISRMMEERRKLEFAAHVEKHYPEERVMELLGLFSNRENDAKIKKEVSTEATVPTIYEYIIGLAWYYFSNKRIDLLGSFNLTLSADFEPLTHAGGGMGDIVIYEDHQVVMLEATLMNANSQKRGEWEPVLRHSVNLKIEEEQQHTNREVTTFFIADTFDANTINIWKAISAVPMESSVNKGRFTNNVVIMPISTQELIQIMSKKKEYDSFIQKVRSLFITEETNFDLNWRNKFVNAMI